MRVRVCPQQPQTHPLRLLRCLVQAFNEAGVAFEPFHLKKERSEGYFDAEGNYIQYRLDEVKDAWLDSLKAGVPLLFRCICSLCSSLFS